MKSPTPSLARKNRQRLPSIPTGAGASSENSCKTTVRRLSRVKLCRPALPKWCHAFSACNTIDVALVGNGPLTVEQQRELSSGAFQVVIRLNFMNNRSVEQSMLCLLTCKQATITMWPEPDMHTSRALGQEFSTQQKPHVFPQGSWRASGCLGDAQSG